MIRHFTKLCYIALISVSVTSCMTMYAVGMIYTDLSGRQIYPSKWDGQCFVLLQDVDLRRGSGDYIDKYMLTTKNVNYVPQHFRLVDQVASGTQLKVAKIYNKHSPRGSWHFRVNLQVMEGLHNGLEVEIPALAGFHPTVRIDPDSNWTSPFWVNHSQIRGTINLQDLNPDSIVFDPTILRPCD